MDVLELNDEDFMIFVESLPEDLKREFFKSYSSIQKKIKGFSRPQYCPINKIEKAIFDCVRKEHVNAIINSVRGFYTSFKNNLYGDVEKHKKQGYSERESKAIIIDEGISDTFKPVFYKLEEFDEEFIDYIKTSAKEREELDNKINVRIEQRIEPLLSKIESLEKENIVLQKQMSDKSDEKEIRTQIESIKQMTEKIACDFSRLAQSVKVLDENVKGMGENVRKLEKNNSSNSEMAQINEEIIRISIEIETIKDSVKELGESYSSQEMLEKIKETENLILSNKQRIDLLNDKDESTDFSLTINENQEYDEMDDLYNLKDDIGDSIESFVNKNSFNAFREFIVETLYNSKPIIAIKENAIKLTRILSSILTGGNYYFIEILNNNLDVNKLVNKVNDIINQNDNLVIYISGFINHFSSDFFMNHVNLTYKTKIIFDINYLKEFRFIPEEAISQFIFFNYNLLDGNIEYYYKYNLAKKASQREYKLETTMTELGFENIGLEIFNKKYEGLVCFSLLPFIVIHNKLDVAEALNAISDEDLRKICEDSLNE